jgi:hypothetical protein
MKGTAMICGNCKATGTGVDVAHVRACYEARNTPVRPVVSATPMPLLPTLFKAAESGVDIEGIYAVETSSGMVYYKVVSGTNTGRWYAKMWDGEEWAYEGQRPLHHLTAANRVSADQASQFGAVTGRCVFCSRKLTDERSIEVGYGPVCAERENLPWGETRYVLTEVPTLPDSEAWFRPEAHTHY